MQNSIFYAINRMCSADWDKAAHVPPLPVKDISCSGGACPAFSIELLQEAEFRVQVHDNNVSLPFTLHP